MIGRKLKKTPDDLDQFLDRDREDEMHDLVEFTEEDIAYVYSPVHKCALGYLQCHILGNRNYLKPESLQTFLCCL